jgi:hypothetical protein
MALKGAFAWARIPLLPVTFRNTKGAHTQDTANEQPEYTSQLAYAHMWRVTCHDTVENALLVMIETGSDQPQIIRCSCSQI